MKNHNGILFYLPRLDGGGAEKIFVSLANEFSIKELKTYFLLEKIDGVFQEQLSSDINVIQIRGSSKWGRIFSIIRHVWRLRPEAVITGLSVPNKRIAYSSLLFPGKTKIVLTVHNSSVIPHAGERHSWKKRWVYARADKVITVSKGIESGLSDAYGLTNLKTIYNPIVNRDLLEMAEQEVSFPEGFNKNGRFLVAVGRLIPQKDYDTLLSAMVLLKKEGTYNLLILGEGHEEKRLKKVVEDLNLGDSVFFMGFQKNPYAYMKKADLLVLSSRFEGFGNILVEAMAVGTPVVSTNCKYGPAEILRDGALGPLVEIENPDALAAAIRLALQSPVDKGELEERSKDFNVEKIADEYLSVLEIR